MSNAIAVYHGQFGRASLYNLDHDLATHAHREGHLTFYVQGRPSTMVVQNDVITMDPTTAVAINPWEPHAFETGDPERGSLCLVLYIKPIWFLETARNAQSWLRFGRSRIEMSSQIQRSMGVIVSLLLEGEESSLFDGYLYELTRECFDQSWQWTPGGAPRLDCASPFTDFRVRKSMRLMSEKLGEEFELDDVAREAGLSRPHFYKLFRKQTGLTPNLFLNTLRMERAIESLTSTEKSVTSIGFDLGFSSQASFTRFFTSNVGIAPSDYRRVAHLALN
ncbi:MAG: helix-turn-helix domain-containing protein [Geminicoccaceae bacterium]